MKTYKLDVENSYITYKTINIQKLGLEIVRILNTNLFHYIYDSIYRNKPSLIAANY